MTQTPIYYHSSVLLIQFHAEMKPPLGIICYQERRETPDIQQEGRRSGGVRGGGGTGVKREIQQLKGY